MTEEEKTPQLPRALHRWTDMFVLSLLFFTFISFFDFQQTNSEEIAYSEFKQRLRDDQIESVSIRGERISGENRY
jgi:ATP-dependent Zn protease